MIIFISNEEWKAAQAAENNHFIILKIQQCLLKANFSQLHLN